MQRQIWLTPAECLHKQTISYPWESQQTAHSTPFPLNLPVFTWYFSVVAQSSINCCNGNARSGTSKSNRRFISSGWWKSKTFSLRSFVALTKSNKTSITFSRNSRVSGPALTVVGMRSTIRRRKEKHHKFVRSFYLIAGHKKWHALPLTA